MFLKFNKILSANFQTMGNGKFYFFDHLDWQLESQLLKTLTIIWELVSERVLLKRMWWLISSKYNIDWEEKKMSMLKRSGRISQKQLLNITLLSYKNKPQNQKKKIIIFLLSGRFFKKIKNSLEEEYSMNRKPFTDKLFLYGT